MSNTLFRWPVRVYYEDTDAGKVVYHARYVAFYERARTEMLRQYNINQQELFNEHIAFAVRRINVEYFQPARLDDLLEVQSEITQIRGASLLFTQHIFRADGTLLSQADVLVVCIDSHLMKPVALPKSLVAEFKQ